MSPGSQGLAPEKEQQDPQSAAVERAATVILSKCNHQILLLIHVRAGVRANDNCAFPFFYYCGAGKARADREQIAVIDTTRHEAVMLGQIYRPLAFPCGGETPSGCVWLG
jgi:hypothetical protein